jgi:hypothetical protein
VGVSTSRSACQFKMKNSKCQLNDGKAFFNRYGIHRQVEQT